MNGVIHIKRVWLERGETKSRVYSEAIYHGESRVAWFEVGNEFAHGLCYDRADAILVGVLSIAMREGLDIKSDVPVSEELVYQIEEYQIPAVTKAGNGLYAPKLDVPTTDVVLENAGAVGTAISCGIDSLHAVLRHTGRRFKNHNVTHLVINNVGSFWRNPEEQYRWQLNHARRFCEEYGYKFVETDSNLASAFPQNHYLTNSYSGGYCILSLQKLWSVYYLASAGLDFSGFSLVNNEIHDSAHYDLLNAPCFSTGAVTVYSAGGALTRFEKTQELVEYPPAWKYLHVCGWDEGPNCGWCQKCCRTLVTLDALGALDRFSAVFDVERYRKERRKYLEWLYRQQIYHLDAYVGPVYDILRRDITLSMRISVHAENVLRSYRDLIPRTKARLIKAWPLGYRLYKKVFH